MFNYPNGGDSYYVSEIQAVGGCFYPHGPYD